VIFGWATPAFGITRVTVKGSRPPNSPESRVFGNFGSRMCRSGQVADNPVFHAQELWGDGYIGMDRWWKGRFDL
jgi:hypothetical protein